MHTNLRRSIFYKENNMKIINKTEFLKLPAGVIYSRYEPCTFRELQIKGETISERDFRYDSLLGNIDCDSTEDHIDKCDQAEAGEDIKLDFDVFAGGSYRDGMFEDNELFAVYSNKDIICLIEVLGKSRGYDY